LFFLLVGLQKRLFATAIGTSPSYCELDGLCIEIRKLGRLLKYSPGKGKVQIYDDSAVVADGVVVPRQVAVVPMSTGPELDLADQPLTL
jgi:hypothetical protein